MHHFGSKDDLITTALTRAIDQQIEVQQKWLRRQPDLTMVQLYGKWWKWMTASRANLSLVRLNYEAAALDTSVTGLAGDVRADQIGVWRHDVESVAGRGPAARTCCARGLAHEGNVLGADHGPVRDGEKGGDTRGRRWLDRVVARGGLPTARSRYDRSRNRRSRRVRSPLEVVARSGRPT